jgi:hypothetical protein
MKVTLRVFKRFPELNKLLLDSFDYKEFSRCWLKFANELHKEYGYSAQHEWRSQLVFNVNDCGTDSQRLDLVREKALGKEEVFLTGAHGVGINLFATGLFNSGYADDGTPHALAGTEVGRERVAVMEALFVKCFVKSEWFKGRFDSKQLRAMNSLSKKIIFFYKLKDV